MQIHELTQTRIDEGVGSFLGGLAGRARAATMRSGGSDFASAMQDPIRQKQIRMLADKSYRAWKAYEKTLLQSNPDARQTGMYEQALLAFVTKNLLGGQYLPNVINKQQIQALVRQLSGRGITEADEITGAVKSGAPTPAERAKLQQKIAAADKTQQVKPGVAPAATSTATPSQSQQPKPTVSAQQEKDLWLKLTQQAAVATTAAPGIGSTKSADDQPQAGAEAGDARSYVQQFSTSMKPETVQSLKTFGSESVSKFGTQQVKSTGNPVADAMLLLAGFRGI